VHLHRAQGGDWFVRIGVVRAGDVGRPVGASLAQTGHTFMRQPVVFAGRDIFKS